MIVSGASLRRLAKRIIEPHEEDLVNPASIDIRIGATARVEVAPYRREDLDLTHYSYDCPYIVTPGQFLLIATYESFHVPKGYVVDLRLKSSRAREGWDHALAFFVDPGWRGVLTMEVKNATQYTPLALWHGMVFAQIIVHQVTDSDAEYRGRYQDSKKVEDSRGHD